MTSSYFPNLPPKVSSPSTIILKVKVSKNEFVVGWVHDMEVIQEQCQEVRLTVFGRRRNWGLVGFTSRDWLIHLPYDIHTARKCRFDTKSETWIPIFFCLYLVGKWHISAKMMRIMERIEEYKRGHVSEIAVLAWNRKPSPWKGITLVRWAQLPLWECLAGALIARGSPVSACHPKVQWASPSPPSPSPARIFQEWFIGLFPRATSWVEHKGSSEMLMW